MGSIFRGLTLAGILVTVSLLCLPETVSAQRGGGGRPSLGHVGGGGVKHAGGGGGNFKMPSGGAARPATPANRPSLGNAHSGGPRPSDDSAGPGTPCPVAG